MGKYLKILGGAALFLVGLAMIEMAVTLPMLLVLVFLLISLFQISKCEQRLIYASYFCGRTAAISFDAETARHNVEDVLKDINADGSNIDSTMDV